MARSRRKSSGATRGRFKLKRMGKGYSTLRKQPIGTRPVLKITPVEGDKKAASSSSEKAAANAEAAASKE